MNRDRHDELNELGLNGQERAKMDRLLEEFRTEATDRAEKPEMFWAAQRTRIAARIREPHAQRGLGWAATVAAVTAMVVFVSVPSPKPVQKHDTKPTVTATATTDDETLLRSVDDTMNSSVPDALAPANILASEMNRGIDSATNRKTGRNNE